MEETVEFLVKHVPHTTGEHMQDCVDELGVITDNLILKQRFLVLVNLFGAKKLPPFFPSRQSLFLSFISQKPKIAETITAQQMHFICKLYEFFLQNPMKLVTVTVAAFRDFDRPTFIYFAHSVLPSIFGYFSCSEHITYAYQFYTALVLQAPKNIVELVLPPYFVSSSTMKYVEAVYDDVNMYFCHDIRLAAKDVLPTIIDQHAKTLKHSIKVNLKLLPSTHLNLMALLCQHGWTQANMIEFLIKFLLIPQIRMMLNASQFSNHLNTFQTVAEAAITLFKKSLNANKNKEIFKNNVSIFEVPKGFSDFDRHFIRFATTTRDASVLFECAKKVIQLPNLLIRLGESETFEELRYRPILLKIYPKNMSPSTFPMGWRNVVFPEFKYQTKEFEIPKFDRMWRFLDVNASSQSITITEYLNQNPSIKEKFFKEESPDLTGLCPQCAMKASDGLFDSVCEKCREIMNSRPKIHFSEYLLNREFAVNYKLSQEFERMLKLQFALKQLKEWITIVDRHYDMTIMSLAQLYIERFFVINPPKPGAILDFSPSQVLCEIADVLNTPHVVALFLSTRISKLLEKWLNDSNRQIISELQVKWRSHMDTNYSSVELPECFQGIGISKNKRLLINQYYMTVNVGLESISLIPFNKRFMFLLSEVEYIQRLIDMLHLDEKLIMHALKICVNKDLIYTLIAIGATLGKSVDYLNALTIKEKKLWHTLEKILSKMTEGNTELRNLFYKIHNSMFDFVQGT